MKLPAYLCSIVALGGCSLLAPQRAADRDMKDARAAAAALCTCAVGYAAGHHIETLTPSELARAAVSSCNSLGDEVEQAAITAAQDGSRWNPGSTDVTAFGRTIRETAEQRARDAVLQSIADKS